MTWTTFKAGVAGSGTSWFTISPTSGTGNGTVTVNVSNTYPSGGTTLQTRQGRVYVQLSGGAQYYCQIQQSYYDSNNSGGGEDPFLSYAP